MEKKVIDLRDCKEDITILLPKDYTSHGSHNEHDMWVINTIEIKGKKAPLDLVPKSMEETDMKLKGCDKTFYYIHEACSTEEDREAFLALIQLRRLWHEWVKVLGEPTLLNARSIYYDRYVNRGIFISSHYVSPLVFKEKSHAEKFIECFGELLDKAKILL